MQTSKITTTVDASSEVTIFSHTADASELVAARVDLDNITIGEDYQIRLYVNGSLFRPECAVVEATSTQLTFNSLTSIVLNAYDVLVAKLVGGPSDTAVDVVSTLLINTDAGSSSDDSDDDGPATIEDAIEAAALGPASVSVNGHSVTAQKIQDLIEADKYQRGKAINQSTNLGVKFFRLRRGGCG